ncbi:asparaginase [Candidatus Woesearchaeota archaeon]|nr:asparaginase [Candidatus Woesearchaeota archaeon]
MAIKVFIIGGTIDNLEYNSKDKAPKNQKSIIPQLLRQSRITVEYNVEKIIFKDSKFVTDEDRELILQKCKKCKEEKIIITHGTTTMPDTAKYLGQNNIPKTIVLLGAAISGNKPNSDALFNMGFAFSSVQLLPKGVYVAMNGKIFSWQNVKKNLDTGFFEEEK